MKKYRKLLPLLERYLMKPEKKIVFLWGPRQTGKSTILNLLRAKFGGAYFNFENQLDRNIWVPNLQDLKLMLEARSKSKYVFIDEVQNNPEATVAIKLLTDMTDYVVFATGSSELRAKTQKFDSLAGRYREYILFSLTIDEFAYFKTDEKNIIPKVTHAHKIYFSSFLTEYITYGGYPGIVLSDNKEEDLKSLVRDSVIKDIVNIYDLKNTDLIHNLLRLLATQIGNLINVSEISISLGISRPTVLNYLSILEKNRIIYLLPPFRTNTRRGYLDRKKVYFYDIGIRNAVIEDFRPWELRSDLGASFENVAVMGVVRQSEYQKNNNKFFFFREIAGAQKEVDLIIETPAGERRALEIKYKGGAITKFDDLGILKFDLVTQENVFEYLI
mgnify:FL=1